jgi:hypothetical protein
LGRIFFTSGSSCTSRLNASRDCARAIVPSSTASAIRSIACLNFPTIRLGYGVGYRYGFRAGYQRGYADGLKAGFISGLNDLLGNIKGITGDIKGIVGNVAQVVAIFGAM